MTGATATRRQELRDQLAGELVAASAVVREGSTLVAQALAKLEATLTRFDTTSEAALRHAVRDGELAAQEYEAARLSLAVAFGRLEDLIKMARAASATSASA